jgi:hypothetical protein
MQLDTFSSTASAALAARTSFARLGQVPSVDEPRMAKVAQTAIFEEALLAALHSRFNELRTVAK